MTRPVPTLPIELADSVAQKSPIGGFAEGREDELIQRLATDLKIKVDAATLLERYDSQVRDGARQLRARQTISALEDNELRGVDGLTHLVEVMYFAGYQHILGKQSVLYPAYNILEEYFVNANLPSGPLVPKRPRVDYRQWSFLGRNIGFPIGVPASVLTSNARWVQYFARNGFNILTYKTVRSRAKAPNSPHNWVFIESARQPYSVDEFPRVLQAEQYDWVAPTARDVSTANSFGVPSSSPGVWQEDLREAFNILHADQCLIVSVMGDDYEGTKDPDVLARDFAATAQLAVDAGAKIVELNVSCPNSLSPETNSAKPPICLDPELTQLIVRTTRDLVGPGIALVAKLCHMSHDDLRKVVGGIGHIVEAISGINTQQTSIHTASGSNTFIDREAAGVSGIAIRNLAIEFVENLVRIRVEMSSTFEIIGIGGVTDPASFAALYEAGASVVQSASGAFANPFLAWECVESIGTSLPATPGSQDDALIRSFERGLMQEWQAGESLHRVDLMVASGLPARVVVELLDQLEARGEVSSGRDSAGKFFTRA